MSQTSGIQIEVLGQKDALEIPLPYITAFTSHPWHEEFECGSCNTGPYFLGCAENMIKIGNARWHEDTSRFNCQQTLTKKVFPLNLDGKQECINCGEDLSESLIPIFTPKGVQEEYIRETKEKDFLGIGVRKFGKLISFIWGFAYPIKGKTSKAGGGTKYGVNGAQLLRRNIDLTRTFYHTEAVTVPEAKGLGLGTTLIGNMIEKMTFSYDTLVFRTIHPAIVRCYEKALGLEKGVLQPAFSDQDPTKRQKWYIIPLKRT